LLPSLGYVNSAAINMAEQISLQHTDLISFGCVYTELGLLDGRVALSIYIFKTGP
jgi:hypothetical protein